jgi:hypothetical protein
MLIQGFTTTFRAAKGKVYKIISLATLLSPVSRLKGNV